MPRAQPRIHLTRRGWETAVWTWVYGVAIGGVLLAGGRHGSVADASQSGGAYVAAGTALLLLAAGLAALAARLAPTARRRSTALLMCCSATALLAFLLHG